MTEQKPKMKLPTLDDYLMPNGEIKIDKDDTLVDIPIKLIKDFPNHPFKVKDDEKMNDLVESVKERGVLYPLLVRPRSDGTYELISGHRRKRAAQKLNIEEDVIWQEFKRKTLFKTNIKEDVFVEKKEFNQKTSLEEKLLKFLLDDDNRQYVKKVKKDLFTENNCVDIYNMLLENEKISAAQILSKINDKRQQQWFSKIAIVNEKIKVEDGKKEEISVELYETFNILCRDIELEKLKKERKLLEKEVLLMTEGKIESDKDKIKRYLQLTSQIKGSGKS